MAKIEVGQGRRLSRASVALSAICCDPSEVDRSGAGCQSAEGDGIPLFHETLCPWSTEARRPAPTCHKSTSVARVSQSRASTAFFDEAAQSNQIVFQDAIDAIEDCASRLHRLEEQLPRHRTV